MSVLARRDTAPEVAIRQALFRRGLRYRVQFAVPGNRRRRIDIAFPRPKIAVFVDGCYWHGCPEHGTRPLSNREWWDWKFQRNKDRDEDTDKLLMDQGWRVIRVWEHEDPSVAADAIVTAVRERC